MTRPGTICPANGAPLEPVESSTPEEVRAVVERARLTQPAWARTSFDERSRAAHAFARRLLERRDEGTRILSMETGRSPTECLMSELSSVPEFARQAVRAAKAALAPERVRLSPLDFPKKRAVIEAVPRGVVAIIAPWNYPASNFFKSVFPALLAGNAVVMKPSEHTPRSGAWVASVLRDVYPADLIGLVQGDGSTGRALFETGIDAVVFTGSVSTGKKVGALAGEKLIPCSVELGGKDAAIVLADCDLDRTVVGIAQWAYHNAGQNCAAIERCYVEEAIADRFLERLTAVVKALRVESGEGAGDLGPLQNSAQLAIVERHVEDARAKGATVLAGGRRTGKGLGYEPTLLDRCTNDMLVVREETFGPVLAVVRVEDAEEAVRRANDSEYGLNGSVWTRDIARGEALARRLEVGVALVNNHALTGILPLLPWTGVKNTGPGVASSRHAYGTFVRRRTLFVDASRQPDPWWFPMDPHLKAMGDALVARGLGSFGAVIKLAGLLKKRVHAIRRLAQGVRS